MADHRPQAACSVRQRRRRALATFVVAATLVLANACLDVREEVWIREDGGARYRIEVVAERAALMAPGADPARDPGAAFLRLAEEARARTGPAGVESFGTEHVVEGGRERFVVELAVGDAEDLGTACRRLFSPGAGDERPGLRVGRLDNDDLVVVRSLSQAGLSGWPGEPASLVSRALAASTLDGHAMVFVVHAPSIVAANGSIDEGRTSATWSVPMGDLVGASTAPPEMRAEIAMPRTRWPWLGLLAVLVLLGGTLVVAFMRRREPETWKA